MSIELALKSAYVEITNKCNLYCKHCYNDSKADNNVFLGFNTIEKIYRTFYRNHISQIFISGGEPFLHPDITRIMQLATEYQVETQVITNGILLDKFCDIINSNTNVTLQLSVDGIGEVHDRIRGRGVFEVVDSNLDKITRGVNLAIKSTINKYSMGQIESIIQYAIKKGARTVAFSPLCNQGRSLANQDIHITVGQLKEVVDKVAILADKYKTQIDVRKIKVSYSQCPFSLTGQADVSPRIDSFGNVFLCSMFTNPFFSVGNVTREELLDVITGEKCQAMTTFLCAFKNILDCKQCLLNNLCQKGCLAQYLNNMMQYEDDMCGFKKQNFIEYIKNNFTGDQIIIG